MLLQTHCVVVVVFNMFIVLHCHVFECEDVLKSKMLFVDEKWYSQTENRIVCGHPLVCLVPSLHGLLGCVFLCRYDLLTLKMPNDSKQLDHHTNKPSS